MKFATTGAEAGELAREHLPDIAVLELLLPDVPGFEILERLRKASPNMLMIVFSRAGHLEDVKAALGFGVSGYFVKGQDTINDVKKLLLNII